MHRYLVLDSREKPIVNCTADIRPGQEILTLAVPEEDMPKLLEHEYIQLVGAGENDAVLEARILRARGSRVEVQRVRPLEEAVRQNLRMPVHFASFLYPISGKWKGRRVIVSQDLSCGGIAFYCEEPLEEGERAQVVVPVTTEPLLLEIQVLRQRPSPNRTPLYGAKFAELTRDEESLIREAVFSLQVQDVE